MKPSPHSQSEAHRLAWRRIINPPQSLPPDTIADLQQCAEMLAEMESTPSWLGLDNANPAETMHPTPETVITEHIKRMSGLGVDLEDIELPTSPHLRLKTNGQGDFIPDEEAPLGLSAQDDDWNTLLEELEQQHNKENE